MKALIIGKNGQLAQELVATKPKDYLLKCIGRNEVDISKKLDILSIIEDMSPDIIINASAYTAVDAAENDSLNAYLINQKSVQVLAQIAAEINCRFIHISTDFVFDGNNQKPYEVTAQTNPQNVYGASKLAGENAALFEHSDVAVIRTSWLYSMFGNNFVNTMLRLMQEKEQLNVVSDQVGSPTYAPDLANFIWCIAIEEKIEKIYHWSDQGKASWYDFAVAIQNFALAKGTLSKKIPINPVTSEAYPTLAKRPKFSVLNTDKSQMIYQAKHWRDALKAYFS